MGFSLPADLLSQPTADEAYLVWPENWPALELFIRCETQWRMGINGPVGMDYPALIEVARLYQIPMPSTLEDVQVIEATVLAELSRR